MINLKELLMENTLDKITLSHIRILLQTVRQATETFQLSSLIRQLEAADNLLLQNPPIDVAVLGQFKAGKSSFLNSFLGQNVLPVGAIPVTIARKAGFPPWAPPCSPFVPTGLCHSWSINGKRVSIKTSRLCGGRRSLTSGKNLPQWTLLCRAQGQTDNINQMIVQIEN